MFGVTTSKTKFGKYLDKRGVKQSWIAQKAKVSQSYVSKLANDKDKIPSIPVAKRVIRALKQYDRHIEFSDFW